MDIGERIQNHLKTELGPAYKDLAAAKERDNALQASDQVLFIVLLVSIVVTGGLVIYRLWLHAKIRQQTLLKLIGEKKDGGKHQKGGKSNVVFRNKLQ